MVVEVVRRGEAVEVVAGVNAVLESVRPVPPEQSMALREPALLWLLCSYLRESRGRTLVGAQTKRL